MKPRHSLLLRTMIAAVAGFSIGASATPAPVASTAPTAASSREMLPAGGERSGSRRSRKHRGSTARQHFSYDGALRRQIEQGIGAMSGRQWTRVRRYLSRANALHQVMKTAYWRIPDQAVIAKRLTPMFRDTARGLVLFGVHPQGVAVVGADRKVFGIPWKWLEGLS